MFVRDLLHTWENFQHIKKEKKMTQYCLRFYRVSRQGKCFFQPKVGIGHYRAEISLTYMYFKLNQSDQFLVN